MSLLFCDHDLFSHRALTPILSGAISGGIVGVAWIIGIIVWLYKRHRRARRAKAAGFRSYREFLDPPKKQDAFIIPPDPAVLKGQARPGQKFVVEKEKGHGKKDKKDFKLKHANTLPIVVVDERPHGEESVPPGMDHKAVSAPSQVPDAAHLSPLPTSNGEVGGDGAALRHQSDA